MLRHQPDPTSNVLEDIQMYCLPIGGLIAFGFRARLRSTEEKTQLFFRLAGAPDRTSGPGRAGSYGNELGI